MAESKRAGGLYYREDGTAVDAEGKEIKNAPKRAPDTVRTEPIGAPGGGMNATELAVAVAGAVAAAMTGAKADKDTDAKITAKE